jgi:hypothetical protein
VIGCYSGDVSRTLIGSLSLLAGLVSLPVHAASLDEQIASILPNEEEDRWLEIPWRTNIMAAIEEAGRVNKPVLLWVMNGNPLGCA